MEKQEAKWYEKASGKRQHKAENSAKLAAKGELKKQRREQKTEEKSKADAKADSRAKSTKPQAFKPKLKPRSSASSISMFSTKNLPAESIQILENFNKIVAETRSLSGKQQTLLPKQIKNLSHQLTDDRNSRRLGYMNDAGQISAYITYFMWWNLVRLTRLFANLPENSFTLNEDDICLDLGSGPLTVPCALWLARPELRSKKLTFYVLDLSQNVLAAGEEIFLSITAKTIQKNQEPWKIIRVKGPLGTAIRQKPSLITCANVFNELAQTSEMQSDYLAKTYVADIEKYFEKGAASPQTVFIVEPGDPHSARLVSLMRDSLLRRSFLPLSPCLHIHACPMAGRTTSSPNGKWCNFAFDTSDAPRELLALSKNANLTKERAALSFVLARRTPDAAQKDEKPSEQKMLELRVASDFIKLPELHRSGYYCCSEIGLVLAVDVSNVRPQNGDLIKVKPPKNINSLKTDKKSGALILEI